MLLPYPSPRQALKGLSMASRQGVVDYILEQIAAAAGVASARPMFGEYGLYCGGKLFGLVCDDQLFVKLTKGGRAFLGDDVTEGSPYPGAKPCFVIPGDQWEDSERLAELVRVTTAELPAAKVKKQRTT